MSSPQTPKLVAEADLIAVSSLVQAELDAAKTLVPQVRTHLSHDEMLNAESTLQAVVIASAVSVRAEQVIEAMEKGLHVLCGKPLSPSPEISQQVLDAYNKSLKKHPKQKVMCGFSRRFDASYRDAHQKVMSGDLGRLAHAAGIFIHTSIHDVDLALWFLGHESVVKTISSAGVTAVQQDMLDHTDRDNALTIIEFYVRPADIATLTSLGLLRSLQGGQEFTDCCLHDEELPVKLEGAVQAVAICCLLQESLISGKEIEFDESGRRLTPATDVKGSKL
ncbi:hypothetical protein N0V84_002224 [Fusarium piperis]|uniref:Gfo/Idh/MocA-like oxidoreductase N-terminal domain-containing protein n=1 Tax=Fusarium piperis TaxID=1435070 RepID=A0A9W8WJX6_9HYPO|nr:hypothetical protein N0V84_002224 [Fusarium piperis]